MKNTWYLIAACFVFAILGISVEDVTVPNQEIVIRFSDSAVATDKTQDALTLVQDKLASIDADNIRIQETADGTLKITYFSDVDVTEIQKIFSADFALQDATHIVDNGQLPFSSDNEEYQIGIYKIQNQNDIVDLDVNGNVLETKSESIRFISVDGAVVSAKSSEKETTRLEEVAFVVWRKGNQNELVAVWE